MSSEWLSLRCAVSVVTATALILAGCTASVSGEAGSAGDTENTSAEDLPTRPAELPIDDVDPCTLFTDDALNRLGVTQEPQRGDAGCVLSQRQLDPTYQLLVTAVPGVDVTDWINGERARPRTDGSQVTTVAGYPALLVYPKHRPADDCEVVAGVAADQVLTVRFGTSHRGAFAHSQACEMAAAAAAAGVERLAEGK